MLRDQRPSKLEGMSSVINYFQWSQTPLFRVILISFRFVSYLTSIYSSNAAIDNPRESWIDPLDLHGYDHSTKTKITKKDSKISNEDQNKNLNPVPWYVKHWNSNLMADGLIFSLEKTRILESELEACKSKCHHGQYEEKFLFSLLQRQTAKILQAASLPVSD